MGCDINVFVEKRNKKGYWEMETGNHFSLDDYDKQYKAIKKGPMPFNWRCYGLFGFLADVRNYSEVPPISKARGLPSDRSGEVFLEVELSESDTHSHSYLTLKELSEFDYDMKFEDRRIEETFIAPNGITFTNGAALAQEGKGAKVTFRKFLGELFFIHLEELKTLGQPDDIRIVFWFDN